MNIEEFREYCIAKKGATEETPFGPNTLVFKVMNKMFALTSLDSDEFKVSLKCDPDKAIQLREEFDHIVPGYHLNKKHWNTVNGKIALGVQIKALTDHSFDMVIESFTKKQKEDFSLI